MKPLTTEDSKTLDAIVAAIPDLMFLMDEQGIYRNVYAKGKEHLLFAPAESLIGKSARDVFEEENAAFFTEAIMESIRSASDVVIEYPLEVGGRAHYFEARIVPLVWQKSSEKHVLVIIREVSQKYEQEQKARLVEKVFEDATEGMMIEDSERFVVKVNPAMQRILEMQEEELIGRHSEFFKQMFHPDTVEEIYRGMETDAFWHGEAEVTLLSGRKKLVWLSITAVMDEQGTVSNFLVMLTDISEVRKSREQLEFMANHDILTGLPNRMLLFEHLEHSIASLKRSGRMGALLFIDLDYFKEINDNFGHHVGDKLLIEVAHRLKDAVRASDTVGRLGGDEFLLIAEDIDHIDEVMVIIQKVRELFAMPFLLDGTEIEVTPSIGVALIPDDGEDAEVLVNAADRAMYVVKERGRDGFEFYSAHYSLLSHEYFKLQRAIKQAIRQEAFVMMFQPQFSIRDGRLSGAEALLRCTLDEIRDVPIAKIISVAEESGTIAEIGQFVFRTVCRQVAQWRTLRVPPLRIAVNLSRRELGNEQLAETIGERFTGRTGVRDHGEHADAKQRQRPPEHRSPAQDGVPFLHRRFRYRLLVAEQP